MKALIISDIHSNIYALEAIWEKEHDSDVIYCAGDLVDYGPFPAQVVDWMRAHDVTCVSGNHDQQVVAMYRSGMELVHLPTDERKWVHDNASLLNEEQIDYLEQLPEYVRFEMDGIHYLMQHQFVNYDTIQARYEYEQLWNERVLLPRHTGEDTQRRIIFGHTHWPAVHYVSNHALWLNPGSVAYRPTRQKVDRSQDAQYMTITDGQIRFHRVDYDRTPLLHALKGRKLKQSHLEGGYRFFGPNQPE